MRRRELVYHGGAEELLGEEAQGTEQGLTEIQMDSYTAVESGQGSTGSQY